ncbi:hypothetical protein AA313_de0201130 [Arthrobotrys entomopaga]|nr:hypothetical protein AA313_de0201130 [Arthrobotrys entomopaga]
MATVAVLPPSSNDHLRFENVTNGTLAPSGFGKSEPVDIVPILGPGDDAQDLSSLGEDFTATTDSFNAILQFPFLNNMVASVSDTPEKSPNGVTIKPQADGSINENGSPADPQGPVTESKTKIPNLRVFFNNSFGEFNTFGQQDKSASQNIVSYSRVVQQLLLKKKTPALYAAAVAKIIEKNLEDVKSKAAQKKKILGKTESKLARLISQIEDEQSSIENDNILDTLVALLQDSFQFAKDTKNQGLQVAGLIDLTTNITDGSFKEKLQKREERQKMIAALTKLEASLRQLVALLDRLQAALPKTIEATQKLSGIWEYCGKQIEKAKKLTEPLTTSEIDSVITVWQAASEAATVFQNSLVGGGGKGMKALSFGTKALAEPNTFPTTEGELEAMEIIDKLNGGRYPLRQRLIVANRPAVSKRLREKFAQAIYNFAQERQAGNETELDPEKVKKAKEALSPPEVTKALEDLNGSTAGMIKRFNEMLQTTFLSSISVPNPWKASSASTPGIAPLERPLLEQLNIDAATTESDVVALDDAIKRYQGLYQALQKDTVPVARNLISYSTIQIQLIPKLVSNDANLLGSGLTLEKYLSTDKKLVEEQKAAVAGLTNRMLDFQNQWQNFINSLKTTLAEQTVKLQQAEEEIKRLSEEQKSKTFWGGLELVGAIICFTAAALIPGAGLLGASAGAGLLTKSIKDLAESRQLGVAIKNIQSQMETTRKMQDALNIIIPQAEQFLESLKSITKIWFDIAQHLSNITTDMIDKDIFDLLRDDVVESWILIQRLVKEYTQIIAG